VPVAVLADCHGVDAHGRPGHERLGKRDQMGALAGRPVDELIDQIERGGSVQQHGAVLDRRHANQSHNCTASS
jgi:hypothetical protein